jgi:hypothetical protein
LETKVDAAATFWRLAASEIAGHPSAAREYIRAARGIVADVWTAMENEPEVPHVLVVRVAEIDNGLAALECALGAAAPEGV